MNINDRNIPNLKLHDTVELTDLPSGLTEVGTFEPGVGLVAKDGTLLNMPNSEGELHGLQNPPVLWEKHEEISKEEGKDYFFPVLTVYLNGQSVKEVGDARSAKEFLSAQERFFFLMKFTNRISQYLYNMPCYVFKTDEEGNEMVTPHKEFYD